MEKENKAPEAQENKITLGFLIGWGLGRAIFI